MREVSGHLCDLVINSVRAQAAHVGITLTVDTRTQTLLLAVTDDGLGMSEAQLRIAGKPPLSANGKHGFGLALLQASAQRTGGTFAIKSAQGAGTTVYAELPLEHLDRPPLGELGQTLILLIACHPAIGFRIELRRDEQGYCFEREAVERQPQGAEQNRALMPGQKTELTEAIKDIFGGVVW